MLKRAMEMIIYTSLSEDVTYTFKFQLKNIQNFQKNHM